MIGVKYKWQRDLLPESKPFETRVRPEAVEFFNRLNGDSLATQIGGDHYKKLAIQPIEYIHKNQIGFVEGSVIKYVSRWKNKNGVEDLKKARHLLDILIEMEAGM